jgi:hypothetical protein
MPYNAVSATKSITVQAIKVSLTVSPSPPWTAGQSVTLKATVTIDTGAGAGRTVRFFILYDSYSTIIGEGTTGSDGSVSVTYTIPWSIGGVTIPCKTDKFRAYDADTGTASNDVSGNVAFPTRISISAPDKVVAGASFPITGKLEYQSDSTTWSPLAGKTVSLYYNGTKIADVTTGSDGTFGSPCTISTPGTYTLKASFGGAGFTAAVAVAGITITVPTEVGTVLTAALPILTGAVLAFISLK